MRKFEYILCSGSAPSSQTSLLDALNRLGRDGWELVGFDSASNQFYFKRELAASGQAEIRSANEMPDML